MKYPDSVRHPFVVLRTEIQIYCDFFIRNLRHSINFRKKRLGARKAMGDHAAPPGDTCDEASLMEWLNKTTSSVYVFNDATFIYKLGSISRAKQVGGFLFMKNTLI